MGAGTHQARMNTGIEGGTNSFGHVVREEHGMENDVTLGEMSGKANKVKNKMAGQCEQHKMTSH